MTADKALDELKAWIEVNEANYPAVAGWSVVKSGIATEKTYPRVTLEAVSIDEHDVLRGVYDPLTVEVILETLPHEDGSTANAATLAEHEADAVALYQILGDRAAVDWIDARGAVRCFDIRGSEGTLEPEDDKRTTTIEVRMVCAIL